MISNHVDSLPPASTLPSLSPWYLIKESGKNLLLCLIALCYGPTGSSFPSFFSLLLELERDNGKHVASV